MKMTLVQLLLLLSGDVELNPGPPKRGAPRGAPEKKEKEEPPPPADDLKMKVRNNFLKNVNNEVQKKLYY